MTGVLEDHNLKDDEPLFITVALQDSCEFLSQHVHEAVIESPVCCIVMQRKNDR